MGKTNQPASGSDLIAAERKRQIEKEGWTAAHDDEHDDGELALAGAGYAIPKDRRELPILRASILEALWPFEFYWWKPTPKKRIRELVKAGALIAAEIDRLQRKASQ